MDEMTTDGVKKEAKVTTLKLRYKEQRRLDRKCKGRHIPMFLDGRK